MVITLAVPIQDALAILQVLGDLPIKSGAFPLWQNLTAQVEQQRQQQTQQPSLGQPQ